MEEIVADARDLGLSREVRVAACAAMRVAGGRGRSNGPAARVPAGAGRDRGGV
jgi:hypothetical protein